MKSCLAGRADGEIDFYQVEGLHGLSSMVAANAEQARGFQWMRCQYGVQSLAPAQLAALLNEDLARWSKIVRESGATID